MKLSPEEYNIINDFVECYRNIYDDVKSIEKEIESLKLKQVSLLNNLKKKRDEEQLFSDELKDKYGEGNFDYTTGEYVLKK